MERPAHADGTATLRLTRDPAAGGYQRILVLDVTAATQLYARGAG